MKKNYILVISFFFLFITCSDDSADQLKDLSEIDIPEYYNLTYSDFAVQDQYHPDWDKYNIWDLVANNNEE